MKNSNHWLEKLLGPTIWSLWSDEMMDNEEDLDEND